MIQFHSLRQYSHVVDGIRFRVDPKKPFLLVYFSENSTFLEDYPKLNLMPIDVKTIVVPVSKVPRTYMTADLKKEYKKLGLYAYDERIKVPSGKNIIFDVSNYLDLLDKKYKVKTYRQRAGLFLKNILSKPLGKYPPNYQKVLIYSVNTTKPINEFVNRKIFPIVQQLKDESLQYDHFVLNTIGESSSRYRLLVKDSDFIFSRTYFFLKNIKQVTPEQVEDEQVVDAAEEVVNKVSKNISPENKEKVKKAVFKYLEKDKESLEKIKTKTASDEEMNDIATTSIVYNTSGNIEKAKNIVKKIPEKKKNLVLKAVDKNLTDEILEKQETVSLSDDPVVHSFNIPEAIDNKSPEHIIQKRQVDFEINLKKDISNSFKVLEKKDVSLKTEKIEIVDLKQKNTEIEKSDVSMIKTTLIDEFGNVHNVEMEIPKIDPITGTFRINGRKKCLVNQIVQCPIVFPKKYDSKFESSYSIFHIKSRKMKKGNFLEIYMGSNKLPLLILFAFSFGFDNVLKDFGISYKIVNEKPKTGFYTKINSKQYIEFEKVDNGVKKELCNSLIFEGISKYNINKEFGSKEYFNELIIEITGRVNSIYLISSNLENIVDPVVKQVLINKNLPYEIYDIMKYMSVRVVSGFEEDRNNLETQRIRGSEVLVHLAQKQILAAYSEYKEQVLSGNKEASFSIPSKKLIRDFIQLELVTDMEYANPLEEIATLTRVTPVGKSVGGIPDKQAIQTSARNVHKSYFGNIDPLDTPEGSNIGITQQLTIDAFITSARGLVNTKQMTNDEGSGMLSTSTCMIPFIENNDGCRVMMAANQSRQMLPLKEPETPIIQSGYESVLTNSISDSFIKRSPCDGKVLKITDSVISILCKDGKTKDVDITPSHLKSGSGKNTLSVFKPKIVVNQKLKNGQVVAEGACISNGSISLGRNLLIAIMPYKGYNFEDGVVINERLVNNNKLTSLHGIVEEVLVSKNDRILHISEIGSSTKKGDPLLRKTVGEIEELIGYDEDDETLDMYSGKIVKKSPGGKIVDIEVFCNTKDSDFPSLQHLIKKTRKKYGIAEKEKFTIRGEVIKGLFIKFKIEQELKIGLGDKLCNRFGNKGIVSLIEKDSNMPRTPWGDTVDMIINPLGIIGRMNVGQMYELYCGLISRNIADKIIELNDQKKAYNLLKTILPKLDKTKNKKFSSDFLMKFLNMSTNHFNKLMDQMKTRKFFPLIIPPFKSPERKDIQNVMKLLNVKSGYKLYLPEFNTKTGKEVPIGYMYICKLEHLGVEKLHGRSTGPVASKTMQPTAGKRKEGGQRMGEAETFVLAGNNCPMLLAEFFGPLSDDATTKNELISDIIQTGKAEYKEPKLTPTKDLLNWYFMSLMLEK